MNQPFRVQGRLIERRGRVVVRDETRQVDAGCREEAFRAAALLREEGFTTWVWAVDTRSVPVVWDLVERTEPPRPAAPGAARGQQGARRRPTDRSRPA